MSTITGPYFGPIRLRTAIAGWLTLVCLMILAMVAIGGITRLTGSGLSIVEWQPVSGILPPVGEAAWESAFQDYQQSPQYRLLNKGMTLGQFQEIYQWEYIHRLFARMVGMVYAVPFFMLLRQRFLDREMKRRLWIGFALGGMQGVLGWCMVKSGLIHQPHVSHYRLAAHLLLALVTVGYLFRVMLSLYRGRPQAGEDGGRPANGFRKLTQALLAVALLQITYGAFTAGLKAGFTYNSFPLMHGHLVAPESFALTPFVRNLVENPIMIQFAHRTIGWVFALLVLGAWIYTRVAPLLPRQKRSMTILAAWTLFQFASGVVVLLLRVPVSLGVLHQAGAAVIFLAILYMFHVNRLAAGPRISAA